MIFLALLVEEINVDDNVNFILYGHKKYCLQWRFVSVNSYGLRIQFIFIFMNEIVEADREILRNLIVHQYRFIQMVSQFHTEMDDFIPNNLMVLLQHLRLYGNMCYNISIGKLFRIGDGTVSLCKD